MEEKEKRAKEEYRLISVSDVCSLSGHVRTGTSTTYELSPLRSTSFLVFFAHVCLSVAGQPQMIPIRKRTERDRENKPRKTDRETQRRDREEIERLCLTVTSFFAQLPQRSL